MIHDLTPRQGIRLAENERDLTSKEREKILAISLIQLMIEEPIEGNLTTQLETMWCFSKMICQFPIPNLDVARAMDMHANPAKYRNYK